MIFYNPIIEKRLSDYGINIPLSDDRAINCFNYLQKRYPSELSYIDSNKIYKLNKNDLLLAHTHNYVELLLGKNVADVITKTYELEKYGMNNVTNFESLVDKTLLQAGGTFSAMKLALKEKFVFYLGGGMHHARSNFGSGFCLINDIVIGIRKLQKDHQLKTAWVIDLDAHKADGTAEITKYDKTIITLSIHMAKGWPLDGSLEDCPSKLDIPIEENQEKEYLPKLLLGLKQLCTQYPAPDIVVVVDGADPYEFDELKSSKLLKLSKEALLERDLMVFDFFQKIPQLYLMAGGYGIKSFEIYAQFLEELRISRGVRFF